MNPFDQEDPSEAPPEPADAVSAAPVSVDPEQAEEAQAPAAPDPAPDFAVGGLVSGPAPDVVEVAVEAAKAEAEATKTLPESPRAWADVIPGFGASTDEHSPGHPARLPPAARPCKAGG